MQRLDESGLHGSLCVLSTMIDKYQSSCPRPWCWPLGCPADEIQVVFGDNVLYSGEAEVVYKDGWPSACLWCPGNKWSPLSLLDCYEQVQVLPDIVMQYSDYFGDIFSAYIDSKLYFGFWFLLKLFHPLVGEIVHSQENLKNCCEKIIHMPSHFYKVIIQLQDVPTDGPNLYLSPLWCQEAYFSIPC